MRLDIECDELSVANSYSRCHRQLVEPAALPRIKLRGPLRHVVLPLMTDLTERFTLRLADHWIPEQALAVYELLKDLTDTIWDPYELVLIDQLCGDLDQDDDAQPDLFDFDDPLNF